MSDGEKKLANPFSTGGGGERLQDLVGAYYLTTFLLQQTPRGLESGTTNRVGERWPARVRPDAMSLSIWI